MDHKTESEMLVHKLQKIINITKLQRNISFGFNVILLISFIVITTLYYLELKQTKELAEERDNLSDHLELAYSFGNYTED